MQKEEVSLIQTLETMFKNIRLLQQRNTDLVEQNLTLKRRIEQLQEEEKRLSDQLLFHLKRDFDENSKQ